MFMADFRWIFTNFQFIARRTSFEFRVIIESWDGRFDTACEQLAEIIDK
jgi:hypothetical protein